VKSIRWLFSHLHSLIHIRAMVLICLCLSLIPGRPKAQVIARETSTDKASVAKAITNADVLKMVKGGLPIKTIILAIQNQKTAFDINPDALLALKRSGVDQSIIDAMIAGGRKPASLPATLVSDRPEENLGDAFSEAALQALDAIEEETGASSPYNRPDSRPNQREVLETLGVQDTDPKEYRQTQTAIDKTDSEGGNAQEKEVVATLRNLLTVKLAINRNWRIARAYGGSAKAADDVYRRNFTSAMLIQEKGCVRDLEPALRQRKLTSIPSSCAKLEDLGSDF
jgi:hypothetical protein